MDRCVSSGQPAHTHGCICKDDGGPACPGLEFQTMTAKSPYKNQRSDLPAFQEVVARQLLHVHPKYLGDIKGGVKDLLNRALLKYSNKLQGVPLCYDKVEIVSSLKKTHQGHNADFNTGAILFDNPCVHIPVRVTWLIFAPKAGIRLTGCISSLSQSHLGLLFADYFNVIIYAAQIESRYSWDEQEQTWSNDDHGLQIGQRIEFEIIDVIHEGTLLTMVGSLDKREASETSLGQSPHPHSNADAPPSETTMPSPLRFAKKRA